MKQADASSVEQYISNLPEERREIIAAVRQCILKHLPAGYDEAINWGMITYQVPLSLCPETYNGRPLMYAALASQKNYLTLHLMSVYRNPARLRRLEQAFAEAGSKLDMGQACIRFKKLEDLPLDAIGSIVADTPVADFLAWCDASRKSRGKKGARQRG